LPVPWPAACVMAASAPRVPPAPGLSRRRVTVEMLQEWIDNEILQHMELVVPVAYGAHAVVSDPVVLPDGCGTLLQMLQKLGYRLDSQCHWEVLGFHVLEGPDPTVGTITARSRSALGLLSLAMTDWPEADQRIAMQTAASLRAAADKCLLDLGAMLRARKQVKPQRLPLWREVDTSAIPLLRTHLQCEALEILTQWSNVNGTAGPEFDSVPRAREIAAMAEKGNQRVWGQLAKREVAMWAPGDPNALTRFLASYLRLVDPELCPKALALVLPLPLHPGRSSVRSILDTWFSPILAEK